MIRVGIVLSRIENSWVGGQIYIRNLIDAVMSLPDRQTEPVLIVPVDLPRERLEGFEGVEVLHTRLTSASRGIQILRKGSIRIFGRDLAMEALLRTHRIDVLSHSGTLGPKSKLFTVTWIADFQHVRMPVFFKAAEISARNRGYGKYAYWSSTVVLSSADAQADLAKFAPSALANSRVLHFVACTVKTDRERGREFLLSAYGIKDPYFYLPNQFWKHKNHQVVVEALALLAKQGRAPLVVCTGRTDDRRNPDHFADLVARAEREGVSPYFKILGLVPYKDLSVLLTHALAVINPSYFEGWSTTVEESKSMGKTVILSDIPVHREQAPPRGVFFDPTDAHALADAMVATHTHWSLEKEAEYTAEAQARLPDRIQEFGRTYEAIISETIARSLNASA